MFLHFFFTCVSNSSVAQAGVSLEVYVLVWRLLVFRILDRYPQLRYIPIHGFTVSCIPLSFSFIPELHPSFLFHQIPFPLVSFRVLALLISFHLSHFPCVVTVFSRYLFLFILSSISISTYSVISFLPSYHVIFLYDIIVYYKHISARNYDYALRNTLAFQKLVFTSDSPHTREASKLTCFSADPDLMTYAIILRAL